MIFLAIKPYLDRFVSDKKSKVSIRAYASLGGAVVISVLKRMSSQSRLRIYKEKSRSGTKMKIISGKVRICILFVMSSLNYVVLHKC